jgi:hypothetical protein
MKRDKNNNEIDCLFLLCHDLGLKIFKAIQAIKVGLKIFYLKMFITYSSKFGLQTQM